MKFISTLGTPALALLSLGITAALATGCGTTAPTAPPSVRTSATASGTTSATGTTASAAAPAPSTSRGPAAGSTTTGTPRCHTRDLSGSFTYLLGSGAAGSASYVVELTNRSTHSCTLRGYAGLLLLDANHKPVLTNAIWDPQAVKPLITLRPGASASARAHVWHNATVGDNMPTSTAQPYQGCQPTSVYIEITPPDETTHLVVPVVPETQVCGRGTIHLSAFVAGIITAGTP